MPFVKPSGGFKKRFRTTIWDLTIFNRGRSKHKFPWYAFGQLWYTKKKDQPLITVVDSSQNYITSPCRKTPVGILKIALVLLTGFVVSTAFGAEFDTRFPKAQVQGLKGWRANPLFTVGEVLPSSQNPSGYIPVGVLDGIGAELYGSQTVRVYVNHELLEDQGYPYALANGTRLTGARISYFDMDRTSRKIMDSGLAYHTIFDRKFHKVTAPQQINEDGRGIDGLLSLCSGQLVPKGEGNFENTIFFTHEEAKDPEVHPHGGSLWALDTQGGNLHAIPSAGRATWENTAVLGAPQQHVALLVGDDTPPAPLWLYIGKKSASIFDIKKGLPEGLDPPTDTFLNRNGLLVGNLYYFVPDSPYKDPSDFSGTRNVMEGRFQMIKVFEGDRAGQPGYDSLGYKNGQTLRKEAFQGGAFKFSRPEDVSTNPKNPLEAVFTSTGRGELFGNADDWGTVYLINVNFSEMRARVKILYDGEDSGGSLIPSPDFGIRSPDNVEWGEDGFIYIQEDRATEVNTFGGVSGRDASIWRIDPRTGKILRIAEIDRSVVLPNGLSDKGPPELGDWETSGILDVTRLFEPKIFPFSLSPQHNRQTPLLIVDVQAHSLHDGILLEKNLVQGGQLLFLEKLLD